MIYRITEPTGDHTSFDRFWQEISQWSRKNAEKKGANLRFDKVSVL